MILSISGSTLSFPIVWLTAFPRQMVNLIQKADFRTLCQCWEVVAAGHRNKQRHGGKQRTVHSYSHHDSFTVILVTTSDAGYCCLFRALHGVSLKRIDLIRVGGFSYLSLCFDFLYFCFSFSESHLFKNFSQISYLLIHKKFLQCWH